MAFVVSFLTVIFIVSLCLEVPTYRGGNVMFLVDVSGELPVLSKGELATSSLSWPEQKEQNP